MIVHGRLSFIRRGPRGAANYAPVKIIARRKDVVKKKKKNFFCAIAARPLKSAAQIKTGAW
jgi:hypothetical protein